MSLPCHKCLYPHERSLHILMFLLHSSILFCGHHKPLTVLLLKMLHRLDPLPFNNLPGENVNLRPNLRTQSRPNASKSALVLTQRPPPLGRIMMKTIWNLGQLANQRKQLGSIKSSLTGKRTNLVFRVLSLTAVAHD